jgi:hypothetical protein
MNSTRKNYIILPGNREGVLPALRKKKQKKEKKRKKKGGGVEQAWSNFMSDNVAPVNPHFPLHIFPLSEFQNFI